MFTFPNPVNEYAARTVAAGVVLLCLATFAFDQAWLLLPITYGFWARVASGPRFSPLGQLATRVVVPRLHLEPKLVPGPPKRFAQAVGVLFSTTSLVLWYGFGEHAASFVVLGLLMVAAILESACAICLGCRAFNQLMRLGVIPESVCVECADLTRRHPDLSAPDLTGGDGPVGERQPVRPARAEEFGLLRSIELAADHLFEQVGIGPFPVDEIHNRLDVAAAVFAVDEPAVGFVSIELVDGDAHIDQLAVLPECGGRGRGRALVDEAIRWAGGSGLTGVTLTTFRDVPWNAPFYRRIGFDVVTHPGPGLAARRDEERSEGLDRFGPRVAMRLPL